MSLLQALQHAFLMLICGACLNASERLVAFAMRLLDNAEAVRTRE